ncbi:hypothetical protein EGW08_003773, partial [Elysia chlorotica]
SYDAVTASGCFCAGHVPCTAIFEIFRLLKPGGYFLNCMREEYLYEVPEYKDRLVRMLNDLEKQGLIKSVEWTVYPNHYVGKPGVRMIYQKLNTQARTPKDVQTICENVKDTRDNR